MLNKQTNPWIVVFTQIPAPYQVDLFNQIQTSGRAQILVVYESRFAKSRFWKSRELLHPHHYLAECSAKKLRQIMEQAHLVIFSGYRNHHLRACMLLREATKRPWIFWGERMGFHLPLSVGALYRKWSLRTLHRSTAQMWGIGSWAVKQFADEFGSGRKYTNVPYISDLSKYLAIERGIKNSRPRRILFSGSLIRRKGFDLFLQSVERLLKQGSHIEICIVGEGELKSRALKLTKSFGRCVDVKGFLQPENLSAVYAECDVICVPSVHDGWGLVVVEGMAAGMPVISTSTTGAAIDLLDNTCGWVIPPNDGASLYNALKCAAESDISKIQKMGLIGRGRAKAYDVKGGAGRFVSLAMNAIQSSP